MSSLKPEWFPLPIYKMEDLTKGHWIRCISLRLKAMCEKSNDEKLAAYKSKVIDGEIKERSQPRETRFFCVKDLTPHEVFMTAAFMEGDASKPAKERARKDTFGPIEHHKEAWVEREEYAAPQYKLPSGLRWDDYFMFRRVAMIDLTVDDEQLIERFKIWLRHQRASAKKSDSVMSGRAFRANELKRWQKFQVLAAYDLFAWRKITDASYTDVQIAKWLWPNEDEASDSAYVDLSERLRKVTKPLIKSVMSFSMTQRLENEWAKELLIARIRGEIAKEEAERISQ